MVDVKMVKKVGVATIVENKATWPVTVQRIDHHPKDESVGNLDPAQRDEIKVEIVRDSFNPAPKAEKGPQRPRRHFRRPGGGRPREELNTTTSTNKPEKNSTLGGVNVEATEPEHVSLFRFRVRVCACREDSFDSSVELLVDWGATSDFMSMQTAKRARLPLYKLRSLGQVLTAGAVQVEVPYYYLCSSWGTCISTPLQGLGDFAGCGTWTAMAWKLQSDCQLKGTVRRHPTWFNFVPVVLWRIKAFHPATVSSRFEAGPSFDTFMQCLESGFGWKFYPTCQGTPRPTLVDTRPGRC